MNGSVNLFQLGLIVMNIRGRLFVWKDAITRAATDSHKVFLQTQGVAKNFLLQSPVSIHINVILFGWLH